MSFWMTLLKPPGARRGRYTLRTQEGMMKCLGVGLAVRVPNWTCDDHGAGDRSPGRIANLPAIAPDVSSCASPGQQQQRSRIAARYRTVRIVLTPPLRGTMFRRPGNGSKRPRSRHGGGR